MCERRDSKCDSGSGECYQSAICGIRFLERTI